MKEMSEVFLVFGWTGSIGQRCYELLDKDSLVLHGGKSTEELERQLNTIQSLSGVIWAQGRNVNDSIFEGGAELQSLMQANVEFIINTLNFLLAKNKLRYGSQLVIVGSIWSSLARHNKMSYAISKSAVSGLSKSLAVDLGTLGIQVNTVSPGPIDSKMTRANLSTAEINRVEGETPIKRLVTLDEVCRIITLIARGQMSGMNGQEIVVDGGWGISKLANY